MGVVMNVKAWIFARGGSKGLPGKNILPLCGKPLIAYAVEVGRQSKYISEIFVSTDDPAIAAAAEKYGATVPFLRPAELASDRSPEHLSWQHAANFMKTNKIACDVFVSLPPTSPLRTAEDVDRCVEHFLEGGSDVSIAVCKSDRHPSFNMVFRNESGRISIAMPAQGITRRQDAPPIFNISTAVYVTSPDYILRTSSYMQGVVTSTLISAEKSIDIDSILDFKLAELIMKERL